MKIFLSLGSNLGDREKNLRSALKLLSSNSKILKVSSVYETAPMYYARQPAFYNMAVLAETLLSPGELLENISVMEKKLRRKRFFKNGPRTIDMDILFCGRKIINEKNLTVPHPLMRERRFVMEPLAEIAPSFKHPVFKMSVKDLARGCGNKKGDFLKLPSDYREAADFLNNIPPFETHYNLVAIKRVLKKLENPHAKTPFVHVAGTSGKTSVSSGIASVLKNANYKTGLYISPHLTDMRERISVGGRKISKKDFLKYFKKVKACDIKLSFFEILTAMAFCYFRDKKVDIAVIEAGLGGRLDSTNVINPLLSVITDISVEHSDFLGDTLVAVAGHKAGIIKRNGRALAAADNACLKVLSKRAKSARARLFTPLKKDLFCRDGGFVFYKDGRRDIKTGLRGAFQIRNLNLIFGASGVLANDLGFKISKRALRDGLKKIKIGGRFECFKYKGGDIILDGAHNPRAIQNLFGALPPSMGKVCVLGIMKDKNVKDICRVVDDNCEKVIITESSSYRSAKAGQLAGFFKKCEPIIKKIPFSALKKAAALRAKNDIVLITGSLYLAADIKGAIKGVKNKFPREMPIKAGRGI